MGNKYIHVLILLLLIVSSKINATQLSGSYIIDSTQTPSSFVFGNIQSAITFLTSSNARTDGGPSNSSPFGVSGPVDFTIATGTVIYTGQVEIPNIIGASLTNTITINGNGNILQAFCTASNPTILKLVNADHIILQNLTIRSLDANYAWGILFTQGSDFNIIENCAIEITSVTSNLSNNSAGIVFSASNTVLTTAGVNGYGNIIRNNNIKGHPTLAGMLYGIVGFPALSATPSNNKFINNKIENFYTTGVYWGNSNGTLFKKNLLTRPTKTTLASNTIGFYLLNASYNDTFESNVITNLFGGALNSPIPFDAFYCVNYLASNNAPNVFYNNLIYGNQNNGSQRGIVIGLNSGNIKCYNNTFCFDNTNATNSFVNAVQITIPSSTAIIFDFRNNIIAITTGGVGAKYALSVSGTFGSGITFDKNIYFSNSLNYNTVSYNTVNYPNFSAWKTFIGTKDQNSNDLNPIFTNLLLADYRPKEGWLKGNGDSITFITRDYNDSIRGIPFDIGALNSNANNLDVALNEIITPAVPISIGKKAISVTIRNAGFTTITSATINWSINGVAQTPVVFSGLLNPGNISVPIFLDSVLFSAGMINNFSVTVTNPNSLFDSLPENNTLTKTLVTALAGVYTINSAGVGTTNFTSLVSFAEVAILAGVSAPVIVNIVPNSGPYTGQVLFKSIIGSSITNTITINGNGNTIQANPIANNEYIIKLDGADYLRFVNFTILTLKQDTGIGFQLVNRADSNIIDSIIIDYSIICGGTFISLSASGVVGAATFHPGIQNIIRNCKFISNPFKGTNYGIVFNGGTSEYMTLPAANQFINNEIIDVRIYGFYFIRSSRNIIRGNKISAPNRTAVILTQYFPIYNTNGWFGDTIENNEIFDISKSAPNSIENIYGIFLNATFQAPDAPGIIRNNLMYNFYGIGSHYGLYSINTYKLYFYNNTIWFNNPTNNTINETVGFYNTTTASVAHNYFVRNNIIAINRGGTGAKIGIQFFSAVPSINFLINNNSYFLLGANTFVGKYISTNYTTLANWKTANGGAFDQQSLFENPSFRNTKNIGFLQPGNPALDNVGANLIASVPFDILGQARTTTPDIGAYEFNVSNDDIGIVRIENPFTTTIPSSTAIPVTITLKNYGQSMLSNATISWKLDSNMQTSSYFSGSLTAGDTVLHSVGTFIAPSSGFSELKIWTENPNGNFDSLRYNDTVSVILCNPLKGIKTINPSLPASATNFTNFSSLFSILKTCGIDSSLVINIAAGTYTGQLIFPEIIGANATNKVIFRSANGNAASVVFTSSNSTIFENYTIQTKGTQYVSFENLTIQNTNINFGRAFSFSKSINLVNSSFIEIRNCILNGLPTTSNSNLLSVIYSPNGEFTNDISFVNNTINNGSIGLFLGGQDPTIPNLTIDSNTFNNQSFAGIILNNRAFFKIRNNNINLANNILLNYGIKINTSQNDCEILRNTIINPAGKYGIHVSSHAFYGAIGALNIANNAIHLQSTNAETYGTYFYYSSSIYLFNNTIRSNSLNNNYGLYFEANSSLVFSSTPCNNLRFANNIFAVSGGLPLYLNEFAPAGTVLCNNNLYATTATNIAAINGNYYTSINTLRNAIYSNSDSKSLSTNISFSTTSPLKPNTVSPSAWYVNGRGGFISSGINNPNFDILGNPISSLVTTGAPDIGAYQITPTSLPPLSTITGSIGYGNTQHIIDLTDTVGSIYWDYSGTLPTAITSLHFTGSLINNPTAYEIFSTASYLDEHWKINTIGGTGYLYNANFKYEPNRLGTVPSVNDLKLAKKDSTNSPWTYFSFSTNLDTLAKTFGVNGLATSASFTGTYDLSPLPVKLISFDAVKQGSNVQVTWNTAEENNSSHFEIQKSLDNKNFKGIGKVKANGNSKTINKYEFIENNAAFSSGNKTIYYRLKSVDLDGNFDVSITKAITFKIDNKNNVITTYPNPFTNSIIVSLNTDLNTIANVQLYDAFGKLVVQKNINILADNKEFVIDNLEKLPCGFYIIKISINDTELIQKLIKE